MFTSHKYARKFNIDRNKINNLSFFWCGPNTPKHEQLNALLQAKLAKTICMGGGLAFGFIACTVKCTPESVNRAG